MPENFKPLRGWYLERAKRWSDLDPHGTAIYLLALEEMVSDKTIYATIQRYRRQTGMAYAKKTDTNHTPIREAFRKAGAWVIDTHDLGKGFPDLLVFSDFFFLVEVKMPGEPFTPAEVAFHEKARACNAPIYTIYSVEEAAALIELARSLWHHHQDS